MAAEQLHTPTGSYVCLCALFCFYMHFTVLVIAKMTEKYFSKIQYLKNKISEYAKDAILENYQLITDIVKNKQLSKGIGSDGDVVGRYSEFTEYYAEKDNISSDKTAGKPYNFYWDGDFLENLFIKDIDDNSYDISSRDGKVKLLEERYGVLLDLTDEHNDWVNKHVLEPFISKKIEFELTNL